MAHSATSRTVVQRAGLQSRAADRWAPDKVRFFQEHAKRWEAGDIMLEDYCQGWREDSDGTLIPQWYASPLGEKVTVDKAELFETLGYRPSDPACRFHASLARVKVFSGGAGAGKSMAAAHDALPIVMTPGTLTYLVAPQYTLAQPEFDYILESLRHPCWDNDFADMMKPENGGRFTNQAGNGKMLIWLWWGAPFNCYSKLEVRTAKSEASLLGVSLDCCILCEGSQIAREVIENKLLMRMFRGDGVMIVPTSPNGMGWVADWYKKGLAGEEHYFATNSDTRMNPTYATDERLESLKVWSEPMSDIDFNEQVGGKPQARHGHVFSEFEVSIHCDTWQDDWPLPGWRVTRGIDFGYTDPFCCLYVAFDEDWRAYFFGEIYERKLLVDDQVRAMAEFEGAQILEPDAQFPYVRYRGPGRNVNVDPFLPTVLDWDAQERAQMMRAGIRPQRKAIKDVSDGIKAVCRALRVAGDGRPRFHVNRKACPNLVREMFALEWSDTDGTPKPKQDDHAVDSARYLIRTLTKQSTQARIEMFSA